MAALEFIRLLEERGLLAPDIVVEITRQVETSKVRITPEAIARLLVDNGQLTRFQATKLISELNETFDRSRMDPTTALRGGSPIDVDENDSVEDLLPEDWKNESTPARTSRSPSSKRSETDDSQGRYAEVVNAEVVEEDAVDADVVDADVVEADVVDTDEVEIHEAEIYGAETDSQTNSDSIVSHSKENKRAKESSRGPSKVAPPVAPPPFVSATARPSATGSPRTPQVPKGTSKSNRKNAWDSFRILGIGSILAVLLLVLVPLLFWFSQGSADDAYQSALNAYETRNYSQAAKNFSDFANSYPRNANASSAKVLNALSIVRENAERVSDPAVSLQSAKDLLPGVLAEDGLAALRPDMTDALLRIADKFVGKIESTPDLKEREGLISQLGALVEMLNDTRFVGAQERAQNALRLRNIEEAVARVNRGYQRDLERLAAVERMTQTLAEKNVARTYEIRRDLLRKYPVLEGDEKLNQLLEEATAIQQGLIVDASSAPSLSTEDPQPQKMERAMLAYREKFGNAPTSSPDTDTTVYLNSKGTLVALSSADGSIRWQRFIDRNWLTNPSFSSAQETTDVTVVMHQEGIVSRYSSANGELIWQNKFDGPVLDPQIDNEDVFVACVSGAVHCLDLSSGTTKWSKHFPQELSAPVAGASSKRQRYVVANNSNLYSISRVGGTCDEVEYLGHQPETVTLPPIWLLNHLLVFENSGPDFSSMRIFETDSDGLNIKPSSQLPIRFRGHVVVPPEVDGRRFAIATDLGEFAVFEVDPSSTKEKVQRVAGLVEQQTAPRTTWPCMVGADLFLASNRIALYEIQVSSQKLNRVWQREDGDEFTGSPISTPNGLIHTRFVRGNLGTRVALLDPKSGESKWETDIAAPITVLAGNDAAKNGTGNGEASWTAIGSQGVLFRFSPEDVLKSSTIAQSESLGRNQRMVKFTRSIQLPNGRFVIFNESRPDQMLLVDPNRKQAASKLFSIDLAGGTVSADPVVIGKQLILPLSNSQIALVNADQMQVAGTPFQPTLAPGEKAQWLNAVALRDGKSAVLADRSRALYKLSTGSQLVQSTTVELTSPLVGRLATLGNLIIAISSLDTSDRVELFDAVELRSTKSVPLDGRVVWGPYAVGDQASVDADSNIVLLQSDLEGLLAFNIAGEKLWSLSVDRNELFGAPIYLDGTCLIGTVQGDLLRINLADGVFGDRSNIGASPSAPPVVLGGEMLIPTDAGSVVKISVRSE